MEACFHCSRALGNARLPNRFKVHTVQHDLRLMLPQIHDGPSSKVVVLHMHRPFVFHYR